MNTINLKQHPEVKETEYRLYINDMYFGTYQTPAAARTQALAQSCQWEIWKYDGTVLVAKGWTN